VNIKQIIITTCQIFHLKCIRFNVSWGSATDPEHRGAYCAPPLSLAIWRGEGKRKEEGQGNEAGEGKGGREKERGRREGE